MGGESLCRFCKREMPLGALKCSTCQEFQSAEPKSKWKHFLTLTKEASGLLTALIAFGGITTFGYWYGEVLPYSKVSVVDASSDADQWTFLYENTGSRPAVLGAIWVEINYAQKSGDGSSGHRFTYRIDDPDLSVIQPGKQNVIDFDLIELTQVSREQIIGAECKVVVEVWNYGIMAALGLMFQRPCAAEKANPRYGDRAAWNRFPVEISN